MRERFICLTPYQKSLKKLTAEAYILREGELAVIASSGETPKSLKEHKLKVHPI